MLKYRNFHPFFLILLISLNIIILAKQLLTYPTKFKRLKIAHHKRVHHIILSFNRILIKPFLILRDINYRVFTPKNVYIIHSIRACKSRCYSRYNS